MSSSVSGGGGGGGTTYAGGGGGLMYAGCGAGGLLGLLRYPIARSVRICSSIEVLVPGGPALEFCVNKSRFRSILGSGAGSSAHETRTPKGKIAAAKTIARNQLRLHRIAGLGSGPQLVEMLDDVVVLQQIKPLDHAVIAQ
jgi:hypothetical protein